MPTSARGFERRLNSRVVYVLGSDTGPLAEIPGSVTINRRIPVLAEEIAQVCLNQANEFKRSSSLFKAGNAPSIYQAVSCRTSSACRKLIGSSVWGIRERM